MDWSNVSRVLPVVMGTLGQDHATGVLVLEQNDGTRKFFWDQGRLVHLQSSVAGEQLGNYLLRQGILDFAALNELLANEEHFRLGEKVVQWGLMSVEERDLHLKSLLEQVMINALEHDIVGLDWQPGKLDSMLGEDLRSQISLAFVWNGFQEAHDIGELCDLLYAKRDWRWTAQHGLLEALSSLTLTPQMAYTLSLIGEEPVGFEMLLSLSGMDDESAARFLFGLWALGGLRLTQGELPKLEKEVPSKDTSAPPSTPVLTVPLPTPSLKTPSAPLPPAPEPLMTVPLDFLPIDAKPPVTLELLGPDAEPSQPLEPTPETPQETSQARARKLFTKSKVLLMQDRTVEAIRLLEESVRLDPDSEPAYESWLALGRCRLTNPAWSTRAVEALQAASRLRPKAGEPWALMGELYHRKGFNANAKACFKKALELDPSVPVPADVELGEVAAEEPKGILGRFKAMLGRSGE